MPEQLTQAQHAQLVTELAELEGPKRAQAVEAIKVARGHGDLSENFEYHDAKNAQGLLERRITILREKLNGAVIVEDGNAEAVSIGCKVAVKDEAGNRIEVELSSVGGSGTVSPSSPLGGALLGKRKGDTVDVTAPKGAWKATIVEIRAA